MAISNSIIGYILQITTVFFISSHSVNVLLNLHTIISKSRTKLKTTFNKKKILRAVKTNDFSIEIFLVDITIRYWSHYFCCIKAFSKAFTESSRRINCQFHSMLSFCYTIDCWEKGRSSKTQIWELIILISFIWHNLWHKMIYVYLNV